MNSIMSRIRPLARGLALATIFIATTAILRADDKTIPAGKTVPYPLTTCVVSGEKLGGDMGKPVVFIYQTNGINQEIDFCCAGCKPKFLADPEKYMKAIQQAEKKTRP